MERVDLCNMIRNAAPHCKDRAYRFMLQEVVRHITEVREGKETLEEFCKFYCLENNGLEAKPTEATDAR